MERLTDKQAIALRRKWEREQRMEGKPVKGFFPFGFPFRYLTFDPRRTCRAACEREVTKNKVS